MKIRCWQHLSTSEMDSIRKSQPVLLVGSAVSDFTPTNLPSGGAVAWDLLTALAKLDGASWPDWLFADAKRLPFEAVLEAYPDQQRLPGIISALFGNAALEPNSLHHAIGDGLREGLFSGLITTNYDLAFDNCFAETKSSVFTICREEDYRRWMAERACEKAYWKIHGTSREGNEDTIVLNLAHERRMDLWKRQLLERLVSDRIIVFLGYSGRDFDICPELATIKAIRGAVWLKWRWVESEQRGLNANQARVLNNHSGTVVLGDLHSFLSRLCPRPVENYGRQSRLVNLREYFDFSLLPEWRVRVLDRLACPSLGIKSVRALQPVTPARRSTLANMLGHAGKYREAARVVESQLADATTPSEKLTCLTDTAMSWYVYGAVLKSRRYFRRAKKLAEAIQPTDYQLACLSKIQLMYWMRRARFWRDVPSRRFHSWIRERATPHYRFAVGILERTNLDGLYILQNDAERIGIAERDGFASAANLGFVALGLRGMHCLKERDGIMSLRRRLNSAERTACLQWLTVAKNYGWSPEAWKWAWILLWQGASWNEPALWRDWWQSFRATEYPPSYCCAMLFRYSWEGFRYILR